MRYVPRRYTPAIIEALAINGALDPELSHDAQAERLATTVRWMDAQDDEGRWSGRIAEECGFHLVRLLLGCTDHHMIDTGLIASAETRTLDAIAAAAADTKQT